MGLKINRKDEDDCLII